jgi:hypothetical protein
MDFMQRNLKEYCNDMQQLDTLLQQKDKEYIQLLKKQEVLEEENDRLYETEIKNIKLSQQIRALNTTISSLQNYNLELQSTVQQLKKRKSKTCDHKEDCGCDKSFCRHCHNANYNNQYNNECDNKNCKSYYITRYENCTCQQSLCIHCTFQQPSVYREEELSEIAHAEAQEAQHEASRQHALQRNFEQVITNNNDDQNIE